MKKNIKTNKKSLLTEEDMNINQSKIRITTMIDYPIYEELKKRAEIRGIGYQTYLNEVLATALKGPVVNLDKALKELKLVVRALEEKIDRKKAG